MPESLPPESPAPEPTFRRDLYAGTAEYYARYRPAYPPELFDDLRARAGVTGTGRLLDLACGTGQVALALSPHFAEVWAVDQEPDMIRVGRREAAARGAENVHWSVDRAEDRQADAGGFELVTIGNAFHRLDRPRVAELVRTWLAPGRCLALVWSACAWSGAEEWQRIIAHVVDAWTAQAEPVGAAPDRPRRPHAEILRSAGFTDVTGHAFPTARRWTLDDVVGYVYSTSVASPRRLGDRADAFEAALRRALLAHDPSGTYDETLDFAYTLARLPESP